MIIAAIDNSISTSQYLDFYRNEVFHTLSNVECPIRIILWSDRVVSDTTHSEIVNKEQIFGNFEPNFCTYPERFFHVLPTDEPFSLYVFTDGRLIESDIEECLAVLNEKKPNIQISHVNLYYIGILELMCTRFTKVFEGIPQEIYIQGHRVAKIETTLADFGAVDYDFIMKDDSFKASVLSLIHDESIDQAKLKAQVNNLLNDILMKRFRDFQKLSIQAFYDNKDVSGCVAYIKKHSFYREKSDFQRKMSSILRLFDKDIDTYSLDMFRDVLQTDIEENFSEPEEEEEEVETEQELQDEEVEYLTCDILYDKCDVVCIPVKICNDFWPEKKMIRNPFRLLESEELIRYLLSRVEPFVMDFKKAYKKLLNRNVSPFSRDQLKGVYVLHQPNLDPMRHNNYVLSTFFCNKLPGKPILWHLVFLYLLATRKFSEHQHVFFREIRYLCQREKYFISLTPHLNPPIVDTLEVCFWYIACVCPVVWANNKKNVLRRSDFISGVILDFYRDVFDPKYERPKEMLLWQLWYELCSDGTKKKTAIFRILSRYFRHERLATGDFGIVLYRDEIEPPPASLSLETVLDVYYKFQQGSNFYEKLSDLPSTNVKLFDKQEEDNDKLEHVRINLKTCHPYVKCPTSGMYWRDCAGKYDQMKQSYLRLFRRYCIKYKTYPKNNADLIIFLNEYIFDRKENKLPELFHATLSLEMYKVLEIFKEVMENMTCEEYTDMCKMYSSEKVRLLFE